tara:strand:+ start:1032 stop:2546 length:1515 start_codon:yes stop_codon:yes gene_type:complete
MDDGFDAADYLDSAGFSKSTGASDAILDNDSAGLSMKQQAIVDRCINDRVFFAEVVLGCILEGWQYDVLTALDSGETRISIRSGNGAGKTCLVAIIILHYILFRNDVKVPVTAPSSGQLKDGLIPEAHKWMGMLPDFLREQLDTTQDRIVRKDSPANNFISFRTARKETPEALQGIHARFVLCCVDEASAVHDAVYEAAQGTMSTPGSIFLMISNPTRLSGYFYDSHHRSKVDWKRFHVTSFDTTRVDQKFVDQIARSYGESSDQYHVKVLGEFPSKDEEALIAKPLITAAFDRDIACTGTELIWGVDVGRGGDTSDMCARKGNWAWGFKSQNYSDTMQTTGWVKAEWDLLQPQDRPTAIHVDSIGIGAGVADRLRELGLPAIDINVSESAAMKAIYLRLRDEMWWKCKSWLESMNVSIRDLEILQQDQLELELSTPLALFTSTGKNGVETKKQMRQRGYKSPNMADALCMTFCHDGAVASGAFGSSSGTWNKPSGYEASASIW